MNHLKEYRDGLNKKQFELNCVRGMIYAIAFFDDKETALLLIEYFEELSLQLNVNIFEDINQIQRIICKCV